MDVQSVLAVVAIISAVLSCIGIIVSVASFFYNIGKDVGKENDKKQK